MRAICGAIIAAGALIGLGLTAVGIGTRYQGFAERTVSNDPLYLKFGQLDSAYIFILGLLAVSLAIGVAIAFIGLAYHHERRHRERLREIALVPHTRQEHAAPRPPA
jgi:cell division protein FtsX